MSDLGNTVSTICARVFGKAPDSVRRAEVGMVNTVCILTVGVGKYILRLNSEKGAYRESGMTFNGRKVEVSKDVIDRFNAIYETFKKCWEERKKKL